MPLDPLTLLREANRRVPALKYAFGIVGIAAVIAIIKGLDINSASIPIGTILLVFGLMILVFVFSVLVRSKNKSIQNAGIILLYAVVLSAVFSGALLISSIFFDFPKPIDQIKVFGSSKREEIESAKTITTSDSIKQELAKRKLWIGNMLNRNLYSNETRTLEAVFNGDRGEVPDSTVSVFYVYEKFRRMSYDKLLSDLELEVKIPFKSTKEAFKKAWLKYTLNPPNQQYDSMRRMYFERLLPNDSIELNEIILPSMKF